MRPPGNDRTRVLYFLRSFRQAIANLLVVALLIRQVVLPFIIPGLVSIQSFVRTRYAI